MDYYFNFFILAFIIFQCFVNLRNEKAFNRNTEIINGMLDREIESLKKKLDEFSPNQQSFGLGEATVLNDAKIYSPSEDPMSEFTGEKDDWHG